MFILKWVGGGEGGGEGKERRKRIGIEHGAYIPQVAGGRSRLAQM